MPPPRPKSAAKIRSQQEAANKTGGATSFSPTQVFAGDKIQHNERAVDYCRTIMAIVSGCACGILGFKGLAGLLAHVLCSLLVSAAVYVMKARLDSTYIVSASGLFFGGLTGGMGTFILFWTMAYDIVHIYG
eukprot:GHVU01062055.1.p1 GENE.GHVU01062055.1~~GHVU01062055.1.p1  ORF type:complete len:132 (-),score=21.77 GHVU01062055.1:83-478(-)